eukprot:SM000149S01340  [mRNA]  locus=s149:114316:123555:- [translate_table: standard]
MDGPSRRQPPPRRRLSLPLLLLALLAASPAACLQLGGADVESGTAAAAHPGAHFGLSAGHLNGDGRNHQGAGSRTLEAMAEFLDWLNMNNVTGSGPQSSMQVVLMGTAEAGRGVSTPPESSGFGVIAARNITKGDLLLRLPPNLYVSNNHTAHDVVPYENSTSLEILAAWLLREHAYGKASYWAPYIRILPASVPGPLHWDDALLGELDYEPALEKVRAERAFIALSYQQSEVAAIAHATLDEWTWAMSIVSSRVFTIKFPANGNYTEYALAMERIRLRKEAEEAEIEAARQEANSEAADDGSSGGGETEDVPLEQAPSADSEGEEGATEDAALEDELDVDGEVEGEVEEEGDGESEGDGEAGEDSDGEDGEWEEEEEDEDEPATEELSMLLPFVDLLNHDFGYNVEWQELAGDDGIALHARRDIHEGETIHNSYGPQNNEELLVDYGFLPIYNPFDNVLLFSNMTQAVDWFLPKYEKWNEEQVYHHEALHFANMGIRGVNVHPTPDYVTDDIVGPEYAFMEHEMQLLVWPKAHVEPRLIAGLGIVSHTVYHSAGGPEKLDIYELEEAAIHFGRGWNRTTCKFIREQVNTRTWECFEVGVRFVFERIKEVLASFRTSYKEDLEALEATVAQKGDCGQEGFTTVVGNGVCVRPATPLPSREAELALRLRLNKKRLLRQAKIRMALMCDILDDHEVPAGSSWHESEDDSKGPHWRCSRPSSLPLPTRLAAVAAPGDGPWSLGDELLSSDTEKTEDNWLYTPPRLAVAAGHVAAPVRQREQRASEPTPTRIPSPRRRASTAAQPARPSLPAQRPQSPARPALERRNSTGSAAARPGTAGGSMAASSSAGLAVRRADPASTAHPSTIGPSGSRPQQAAAPRSSSAGQAVRGRATVPATTAAVAVAAKPGPPAIRSRSLPRSRPPAANGGGSPLSARPTSLFSQATPAAEALAGGPALTTARPRGAALLLADERTPPNLRTSLSERGAGGGRIITPAVAHLRSSTSSTTLPPPSSAFNSSSSRALRFHEVASKPRWQAGGSGSPAAAPSAVARSSGSGGSAAASPRYESFPASPLSSPLPPPPSLLPAPSDSAPPSGPLLRMDSLREYSGGPASRPRLGLEAPSAPPPPLSAPAPLPVQVLTSPSVPLSSAAAPHGRRVSFHDDQDDAGASGTRLSQEAAAELEALPPLPLLPALSPLLRGSAAMASKRPRRWRPPPAHLGGLFPGREEYYGEQPVAAAANFDKVAGSSDDDNDDDEEEGGDDDGSWGGGDATEVGSSDGEGGALADVEGDSDYAAAGRNDGRGNGSGARTNGGGGEGSGLHGGGCAHSRNSSRELYIPTPSLTIGAAEQALVAAMVGISGTSGATKVAPGHDHDGVIGGILEAGDTERQPVEATAAAAANKPMAGPSSEAGLLNKAAPHGAAASALANGMASQEAASSRAEFSAMTTSTDLAPLVVCEVSREAAADTVAAAPLAAVSKAAATAESLPAEGCVGGHRQVAAGEERGPALLPPAAAAALLEEDEQALYGDLVGGVRAQIDGWKEEDSSLLHEMELGSTAAAAALWDVTGNGGGGPAEGREGDSGNRGPPVAAPTTPSSFGSAAPSAEADGAPHMVQTAVSESSTDSGRKAHAMTATATSADEARSLPEPQQPLPRAVTLMQRPRPRGLAEGQAPQAPPHSSLNASMSDSRTTTTTGSSAKSTSSDVIEWDHSSSIADEACSEVSTSSTMLSRHTTLEEATNTILFCSSIVHDMVFKAALIAEANAEEARKRLEEARAAQVALPWAPSPMLKVGGVTAATEQKVPLQPGCTCRIL